MDMLKPALVVACTLALAACGNHASSSNEPAGGGTAPSPAATAPVMPTTPATTMSSGAAAASAATAGMATAASGANGKPAAVVTDCSTEIEASDQIQYNVGSITIPSSCTEFKITLKHTGNMPVASMGHDVVITKASDMQAVDKEGAAAGLDNGYVKASDPRIIAHTKLIGGGQTTSVSFPVSKLKTGGPYEFFCSFPGHSALMHGTISVE